MRNRATGLRFICDHKRHLVCEPYSTANLHRMADHLNIHKRWFHGNHYDIPKRRMAEVMAQCEVFHPKEIVQLIKHHTTCRQ